MPRTRTTYRRLILTTLCVLFVLLAGPVAAAGRDLTPVTLQLKWRHQFQFAGFYAAQAMGYYQDEGLKVAFRETEVDMDPVEEVLEDSAQFGVSDSGILLDYFRDEPVVVLGVVFQHSPTIVLTRADSGINTPRDLLGKKVMIRDSLSPAVWAMLASQLITKYDITTQKMDWGVDELVNGEVDAMVAYLTDHPYLMKEKGIPATIIRPVSYGIDFYGDCLFTSVSLAESDPELVESFTRASFKGWKYAMTHVEEITDLILSKYDTGKTRDELLHEAEAMRGLILPQLVPIGSMNPGRWKHIADVYRTIGMTGSMKPLDDFMYVPKTKRHMLFLSRWAPFAAILSVAAVLLLFGLLLFNRRLKLGIQKQTNELNMNRISLRQVLDLVPNLVYAKDSDGRFLLANRAVAESLGTTVSKMIGKKQFEIHPDKKQARRMQDDDKSVLEKNLPKVALEEQYTYADGSEHWLQTTRLPYVSAETGKPAVLVLSIDITNRRMVTAAIKENEARFKAIFDQTYQFTSITDTDGTLTQVNRTTLDSFQIKERDVIGKKIWDAPWWKTANVDRQWVWETVERAADGETVQAEIAITGLDESARHFVYSIKPAYDDTGSIIFLIPEAHEVTSLKETEEELRTLNEELELRVAERTQNLEQAKSELEMSLVRLKETQKELIMSEKLAALGSLVAGVAHEINTPLGVGVTAASFLQEKMTRLEGQYQSGDLKRSDLEAFIGIGRESTTNILANLERAAELIRSFKQVAADQSSELPRQFNLKEYVDEALMSLRPKYKRTKHTIVNACPDVTLFSYPGAFMHIITNLMVNALTHAFDKDEAGSITIGGQALGDVLEFTFSDDGKGIPPELGQKIFEPFYTTKRGEGGTGLGLHIVYNTVTRTLGGTIHYESAPGKGTTYTITMPLDHSEPQTE